MEGRQFDDLARTFVSDVSRRGALRRIGAFVAGAGLALVARRETEAAVCRQVGEVCRENANCCNGMCGGRNETGRRTCLCNDGQPACRGKCCVADAAVCVLGECLVPTSTPNAGTEALWAAVLESDALAPTLSFVDFAPQAGHRFQLRAAPPGKPESLVECEVVEAHYPTRVVFTWRSASMAAPATAALTLEQTDKGPRLGVNRVDGDPASCDVATALLGRNWQRALFAQQLPKYLEATRPRG
jgi:uncharacterized protein YndB with AHSA1/START domain